MTGGTENRFWIGASCRKLALCLAAAVICSMMMSEQALCCHVIDIYHFEVAGQQSGPWDDTAAVCKCTFWVSLKWGSAGSSNQDKWENDWIIQIWSPGAPTGPAASDYRPPSGSMVDSITLPWDIDGNYGHSNKEAIVEFDGSSLSVGTHTLRAWIIRDGTSPENAWEYSTTCTVTVVEITSLVWEKYRSDSHDLDTVAGGKRIFPGKKTYNDAYAADRKKVWVKATISPPLGDIPVYFKWIDPDDPSSDPVIDPGGSAGDDNRGEGAGLGPSLLRTLSETTNSGGEAKVVFTVSMQPGDNFIVKAVPICEEYISDATCAEQTPLLTTWRKLHIERDSMEEVATSGSQDNWVRGGLDTGSYTYDPVADETTVCLGQDLADCWEESKQLHFEDGTFLRGVWPFTPVRTISHWFPPGYDDIVVDGNAVLGWPCSYALRDDDNTTLLPDLPDLGKCDPIFEDCYIDCEDDARGSNQDVAFKRNLGGATTEGSDITNVAERGSSSDEADDWWVVYIVSGYQPGYTYDADPDTESLKPGVTEGDTYQASVTFLEILRECGYGVMLEQQIVVHEFGHQVLEEGGSAHTPNTIMSATLPVSASAEKFSPAHIYKIRGEASSPGD